MATVEVVSATPALADDKPEATAKDDVITPESEHEAVKEEQTVAVEEVPAPVVVAAVEPVSEEKEVKEGGEEVGEVAEEEEKEEVLELNDTSKVAPGPGVVEEKAVVADAEESAKDHEKKVVVAAEEIKEGGRQGEEGAPAAEKAE